MNEKPVLYRIERIRRKTEDGETLLQIGNLAIARGEFIALAGANGAGKTLLLRYLLGLENGGDFSVYLRERKLTKRVSQAADLISYVPQHPENYILGLTVIEDLLFSLASKDEDCVLELVREFQLESVKDRAAIVLSGGEMRRLAIASALTTRPHLVFLDEPFGELDYQGTRRLLKVLCRLHRQGVTVVLVTHDLAKVLAHCTRLIILHAGRVVFDAPPGKLAAEHERWNVRIPSPPFHECTWLD